MCIIIYTTGNDTGNLSEPRSTVKWKGKNTMTIKDIARLCGVSVSTVSRVLNGRPDVSDDVRSKVLETIKSSNYIPNTSARDLVCTKSNTIGLVVRGLSNPFYTDIIRAIERTVTQAGYTLVMQQISSCDDEIKCGAMMEREKRLLGVVFLGGQFDYSREDLALLNVPFVCCSYCNRYGTLTDGEYSSVSIADEATAAQAVKELYRNGHRRIAALISQKDDLSISQLRYEGYLSALRELGLPADDTLVMTSNGYNIRDAYDTVYARTEKELPFTALFAISDAMAIGAMRALRDRGYRIPEDCSVIAIDGLEISAYIDPPLTTLCQPMEQMGTRSAQILLDMIQNGSDHVCEILPTALRQGGSVAQR